MKKRCFLTWKSDIDIFVVSKREESRRKNA